MKNLAISRCEVCGDTNLKSVIDLGNHPLCDDLVEVTSRRKCQEYPINILYCETCKTAHQKYQVEKRTLFPTTYHYRSRFTADVLNGMKDLVDNVQDVYNSELSGLFVLDIGCNDGSLLDFFKSKGTKTCGIEPTDAYQDAQNRGHIVFNDFFSRNIAQKIKETIGSPDIITFTNVFAHIEDLDSLIAALNIVKSEKTLIVIENHYLGSVIEKKQFDTFYHEHPRTYSYNSFVFIAKRLGLDIVFNLFPKRYGGNIRVILGNSNVYGKKIRNDRVDILDMESSFGESLAKMQKDIDIWKRLTKDTIDRLVAVNGPIPAKAFPGRAAILIKLLDVDADKISRVFEKPGSMKIGHFVPGTRIPIVSDEELIESIDKYSVMLNLAWHISDEIRTYLRNLGYYGEIVDILNPKELN